MSRPIAPPPMTPELHDLLSASKLYRPGRPLKVFDALLHHPRAMVALRGLLAWGDDAVLGERERELLILRTAALTHCAQEWSVHCVVAVETAGLTATEVDRLTALAVADDWGPRELALIRVAESVCASDTVDDALWDAATGRLRVDELIEALVVIGYYRMVAGLENALGVPAEVDFEMPVR